MSLLDHAAPRILPRLFDERVQVPWTSGWLRFPFRGNAELRFRSLWGFVGHGPTPWIYEFARRYISRPGSSKAPCLWGETIKPFPPRGGPLSPGDAGPRRPLTTANRHPQMFGGHNLNIRRTPSLRRPCSRILLPVPRYGSTPPRSARSGLDSPERFEGYLLPWRCTPAQRRWQAR